MYLPGYPCNLSGAGSHIIVINPHLTVQNHLLSQAQLHQLDGSFLLVLFPLLWSMLSFFTLVKSFFSLCVLLFSNLVFYFCLLYDYFTPGYFWLKLMEKLHFLLQVIVASGFFHFNLVVLFIFSVGVGG
jgi:hypothetical protein